MHSSREKGFIEMILIIVGFLVLVGVGVYWFMAQAQNKLVSAPTFTQTEETSPGDASSLTDTSLELELSNLQFEDPTSDIEDIDQDLSSL